MGKDNLYILHENKFGYIAKCFCCNQIQVSLGNTVFNFSKKEYEEFDSYLNEIRATHIKSLRKIKNTLLELTKKELL